MDDFEKKTQIFTLEMKSAEAERIGKHTDSNTSSDSKIFTIPSPRFISQIMNKYQQLAVFATHETETIFKKEDIINSDSYI